MVTSAKTKVQAYIAFAILALGLTALAVANNRLRQESKRIRTGLETAREAFQANLQPEPFFPHFIQTTNTGTSPIIPLLKEEQWLYLTFDVQPGEPFQQYRCVLESDQGHQPLSFTNQVLHPDHSFYTLYARFPAEDLSAGLYTLTLHAMGDRPTGQPVARYPFNLEYK